MLTGTVSLSPVNAADNVTNRTVTVTVNGTALPPITATTDPATFLCGYGDAVIVTDIDTNAAGPSLPSPVFTVSAPPLPQAVPTTPTVLGVTFA